MLQPIPMHKEKHVVCAVHHTVRAQCGHVSRVHKTFTLCFGLHFTDSDSLSSLGSSLMFADEEEEEDSS